jgi:hypothetical protein
VLLDISRFKPTDHIKFTPHCPQAPFCSKERNAPPNGHVTFINNTVFDDIISIFLLFLLISFQSFHLLCLRPKGI